MCSSEGLVNRRSFCRKYLFVVCSYSTFYVKHYVPQLAKLVFLVIAEVHAISKRYLIYHYERDGEGANEFA